LEFWFRGYRWKLLIEATCPVSTGTVYKLESAGIAMSNLLPLRLGELGRAFLLSRSADLSMVAALSTIAIERVLDVFSMMFIVAIAFGVASFMYSAKDEQRKLEKSKSESGDDLEQSSEPTDTNNTG